MGPIDSKKVFAGDCSWETLCSSTEITARFLGGVRGLGNSDPDQLLKLARDPRQKKERQGRSDFVLLRCPMTAWLSYLATIQIIHR
jgi:hypothetical protein